MSTKKTQKKILLAFSFASIIAAAFFYFGFKNNFLGIQDLLSRIPAFHRFVDKTGSGRSQHYEAFFERWLNYPYGGMFTANLFGGYEIHNAFLQVYAIGGLLPFALEVVLLVFWFYLFFATKITNVNRVGIVISAAFSIAFFAICLFEPMITSEPFMCSLFFLCAGHLYSEWTRQKNKNPLLTIGLLHNEGSLPTAGEIIGKSLIALALLAGTTALAVFSDYGAVFSVISLLLLVLGFVLLDKADYSPASIVKTLVCLTFAAVFTIFLNTYLPTNTWMYALAKSALSIAVFVFLRIIVVSKNEEKDGYYRLRNFFTKLARDIDGSPEENLVSQDLQTSNEGE